MPEPKCSFCGEPATHMIGLGLGWACDGCYSTNGLVMNAGERANKELERMK